MIENRPKMAHKMKFGVFFVPIFLLQIQNSYGFPTSGQSSDNSDNSDCSTGLNGTLFECSTRVLGTTSSNIQFDLGQIANQDNLHIKCNDKLFYESFLTAEWPFSALFNYDKFTSITIDFCKIRKIPTGHLWLDKFTLKSLKIHSYNAHWGKHMEIEQGSLGQMSQLEQLDLSYNNLAQIPAFCSNYQSLLRLNLSHNALGNLKNILNCPQLDQVKLQQIDLSHNSMQNLDFGGLQKLQNLVEFRADHNLISELPHESQLAQMINCKILNLSSNQLTSLPGASPSKPLFPSNLIQLHLENNSISALSTGIFANLDHLLLLDLSRNKLTSLWVKEPLFSQNPRLVVLKLSYNQLSYLEGKLLSNLPALQALHLDNNRIESIHPNCFGQLGNLHFLDLSRNRLTTIDSRLFGNLNNLRQLYLDHNRLRNIDEDSMKNCTNLEDLGLAGNTLGEVPRALNLLGNLRTLDIGENRISTLQNDSFSGMGNLYGLRIVANRIGELPTGFCDPLTRLRVLNMAQNRLGKVQQNSLNCPELRALRLDTNIIQDLPSEFGLPSLLWLNISGNRLRSVENLKLPLKLEWLDLSHNKLSKFELKPEESEYLRIVDISHNQLENFGFTTGHPPPVLETLRLNYNFLKNLQIYEQNSSASRLKRVELVGNQIESLEPPKFLQNLPYGAGLRVEFYLSGNPFLCDCSLEQWLYLQSRGQVLIQDLDSVSCQDLSQSDKITLPVPVSSVKNFLCPYTTHCPENCGCCDFDACDCQRICPENCTCTHDTSWNLNIVKCSNINLPLIPPRIPMDSTELYLDGNNLGDSLNSHTFIGKRHLRSLYLNSSRVDSIKNKTFNGLKSLEVLHLEHNLLPAVLGYEFGDLSNLQELYLQYNHIKYIEAGAFSQLKYLSILRLDGNLLVDYPVYAEFSQNFGNFGLQTLSIGGNPWSCDCEFLLPLVQFIGRSKKLLKISEISQIIKCPVQSCSSYENNRIAQVLQSDHEDSEQNQGQNQGQNTEIKERSNEILPYEDHGKMDQQNSSIFWTLTVSLSLSILALLGLLVLIFRREFVSKFSQGKITEIFRKCSKSSSNSSKDVEIEDGEKLFDAYFLYSRKDEDILTQKIAPVLELGLRFRLCLHYRDLCVCAENPWNGEMVESAINSSRRVFILLSRNFQAELQARGGGNVLQTLLSQHKCAFILLPPLNESNLPNFNNNSTNSTKILDWTDENFWSKLKSNMPDIPKNLSKSVRNGLSSTISPGNSNTNTLSSSFRRVHQTYQDYPYGFTPRGNIVAPQSPQYHSSNNSNYPPNHLGPHIVLQKPTENGSNLALFSGFSHQNQQQPPVPLLSQGHQNLNGPVRFSDSFKRHQMSLRRSFKPLGQESGDPNTVSGAPYRVLQPNYSSSDSSNHSQDQGSTTMMSSGSTISLENPHEHIYSTLDLDSVQGDSQSSLININNHLTHNHHNHHHNHQTSNLVSLDPGQVHDHTRQHSQNNGQAGKMYFV